MLLLFIHNYICTSQKRERSKWKGTLCFKFLRGVMRLILAMFLHLHPPQSAFPPPPVSLLATDHTSKQSCQTHECLRRLHYAAATLHPYAHDVRGGVETPLEPTSWPLLHLSASCEIHSTPPSGVPLHQRACRFEPSIAH